MFSLKPGLAYYALSIAVSIVVAICAVLIVTLFGSSMSKDASEGDLSGVASRGAGMILIVILTSVVATFAVSAWLMPSLCHWIDHKKAPQQAQ